MINYRPETSLGQIGFRYSDGKLLHPLEKNVVVGSETVVARKHPYARRSS